VVSRVWALVRKEFIQIWRDRRTLTIALLLPAVQIVLFGYAINTTVEHLPTVVLDQADDRASRVFIQALVSSSIFEVVGTARDVESVHHAVDSGAARVGVIVPPEFARDLAAGRSAQVQVLIDGSDPTIAQGALFAAVAIGQDQAAAGLLARLQRLGIGGAPAVDVRPLVLYNPGMVSVNFMIPGLIGMILQYEAIVLTAVAIVREREQGTMEQLIVTPVRPWELMVGKLLPYVLIAFADVGVALAVGTLWFQVQIAGSLWLLLALSLVFLMSSLGIGLLISTVSQTQRQAMQMQLFILLPSFILSGFIFPRDSMPWLLHQLGYLLPLTYFLEIVRGIMLKGVGLEFLWGQVLPMALLAVAVFGLSALRFRKQLA
jgi:ABC-2 type transport system permease protein